MFGLEVWESALIAGVLSAVVAIVITRLIEHFGGIMGGVLGTVPTTIVLLGFGFATTIADEDKFRLSLYLVPMGMFINMFFLMVWRFLPVFLRRRQFSLAANLAILASTSLAVWCLLATSSFFLNDRLLKRDVHSVLAAGLVSLAIVILVGLGISFHHVEAPRGSKPVTWAMLLLRGLFSALAIGFTVYLGSLNPSLGGIFATFPVLFMTTMVSLWVAQGSGVPTGATGPMILGGTATPVYALAFAALKTHLGMFAAFAVSYAAAVAFVSIPAFLFLRFMARWHARRHVRLAASNEDGSGAMHATDDEAVLLFAEDEAGAEDEAAAPGSSRPPPAIELADMNQMLGVSPIEE
jgi:hypothetical protein